MRTPHLFLGLVVLLFVAPTAIMLGSVWVVPAVLMFVAALPLFCAVVIGALLGQAIRRARPAVAELGGSVATPVV